jgi:hypothetical protein
MGSANGRPTSRRHPPSQYVENVVPNWQTFSGAAAAAVTTTRALVGCIPNKIPDGFNRKCLRTSSETKGVARAGATALANAGIEANADAVATNGSAVEMKDRVIFMCALLADRGPGASEIYAREIIEGP